MKILSTILLCGSLSCVAQTVEDQLIATSGLSAHTHEMELDHIVGDITISASDHKSAMVIPIFFEGSDIHKNEVPQKPSDPLIIWPNPTSKYVYLDANDINGSYQILDSREQVLTRGKLTSEPGFGVDLSEYIAGVYFLHIQNDKGDTKVYRIVKK